MALKKPSRQEPNNDMLLSSAFMCVEAVSFSAHIENRYTSSTDVNKYSEDQIEIYDVSQSFSSFTLIGTPMQHNVNPGIPDRIYESSNCGNCSSSLPPICYPELRLQQKTPVNQIHSPHACEKANGKISWKKSPQQVANATAFT